MGNTFLVPTQDDIKQLANNILNDINFCVYTQFDDNKKKINKYVINCTNNNNSIFCNNEIITDNNMQIFLLYINTKTKLTDVNKKITINGPFFYAGLGSFEISSKYVPIISKLELNFMANTILNDQNYVLFLNNNIYTHDTSKSISLTETANNNVVLKKNIITYISTKGYIDSDDSLAQIIYKPGILVTNYDLANPTIDSEQKLFTKSTYMNLIMAEQKACPEQEQCSICPEQKQCSICPEQKQCPICPEQKQCPICPEQKQCPEQQPCICPTDTCPDTSFCINRNFGMSMCCVISLIIFVLIIILAMHK